MKYSEVRNLSEDEIRAKLQANHEELFRLRLKDASRQLSDTAHVRNVRRDIARLKTRERQLELEKAVSND
ncbi:MAG TPA: 50S ribosomal protein L29 [Chloroflexota bacterium]|nr:50S ribosomal protein L29 [Chloroflexota bacterium]